MLNKRYGGVLLLYALCGGPAESQLTLLLGGRDRERFERSVFDFVFGIFSPNSDPIQDESHCTQFLRYIYDVQVALAEELRRWGMTVEVPPKETPVNIVDEILRIHRELCKFETREPELTAWENRLEGIESFDAIQVSQDLYDLGSSTLDYTVRAYEDFCLFRDVCNWSEIEAHVDGDVVVSEIMAFLAHVARGYAEGVLDKEDKLQKDWEAGFLHLKRVVLDIRKGILDTILGHDKMSRIPGQNDTPLIDTGTVTDLLAERHRELLINPHHANKCTLYEGVVRRLLRGWVEHLIGQNKEDTSEIAGLLKSWLD